MFVCLCLRPHGKPVVALLPRGWPPALAHQLPLGPQGALTTKNVPYQPPGLPQPRVGLSATLNISSCSELAVAKLFFLNKDRGCMAVGDGRGTSGQSETRRGGPLGDPRGWFARTKILYERPPLYLPSSVRAWALKSKFPWRPAKGARGVGIRRTKGDASACPLGALTRKRSRLLRAL